MAKKQSRTQDLIGLNRFGENGVITDAGVETVWFLVGASNLSVLSPEHIGEKIVKLTGLLQGLHRPAAGCNRHPVDQAV